MKLLKVDTLVQARERLLKAAKECLPETEQVALADASDRIYQGRRFPGKR